MGWNRVQQCVKGWDRLGKDGSFSFESPHLISKFFFVNVKKPKKIMGNLPQHHSSHKQEAKSLGKLRELLPNDLFILRSEDGGDYGVDRILEVVNDGSVTNIRAHVQVKSQKKETKSDSVRFPVPINTINYLLNTIHSLFIIYSVNEDAFYWEWTRQIALSANGKQIDLESINQKTFSYTFQKMLDLSAFEDIHKKLISDNQLLKDIEVDCRPLEKTLIESHSRECNISGIDTSLFARKI